MDLKPHNVLIKRPATAQQQQHQQQRQLSTTAANPGSIPQPGSRPRIRATALPDSDEEFDLEAGASLVSLSLCHSCVTIVTQSVCLVRSAALGQAGV
jgi:hypothetical protein